MARRNKRSPITSKLHSVRYFSSFFGLPLAKCLTLHQPACSYGLLGLKLYFLYVPLMYVGYSLIDSELDLRRFLIFTCVLFIVIGSLGIAQAIIGPTFLNPVYLQDDIAQLSTLYRMSPITGQMAYRPNSVFVSNGRFQNFVICSWTITLGFGAYLLLRSKQGRFITFITLGVLAGAAVMSRCLEASLCGLVEQLA